MRSFKKIAAMMLAVAMLCSFTALGAEVVLKDVADVDSDNPVVTLGYDWSATTAAQTTMLVVKDATDIMYVNQFGEGASDVTLNLGNAFGSYTVVAGGMDVDTATTETFAYTSLAYDVTLTKTAGGNVSKDYAGNFNAEGVIEDVAKNTEIKFTFNPYVGYVISSLTVNGEAAEIANNGGELTVVVTEDTAIDVVFTEAEAADAAQAFTSEDIFDVPVAEGAEGEEAIASKIIFGKAIAPNGGEVVEAGMYLEKKNAEGEYEAFIASKKGIGGPFFAASGKTADNKYGIRFFRFEKGEYRVSSYVKYGPDAADVKFGKAVEFEVK